MMSRAIFTGMSAALRQTKIAAIHSAAARTMM